MEDISTFSASTLNKLACTVAWGVLTGVCGYAFLKGIGVTYLPTYTPNVSIDIRQDVFTLLSGGLVIYSLIRFCQRGGQLLDLLSSQ